ncbi:MAG TPA: response regulator [Steroidobacteraceae bacterium]|jgi:CheY-like chemotaxis protein|nr:response regulator [Steroidobacteraceae bacterium]
MGKRALIVDDSKSARLSLARILEKHAIEVDTAESAELALEYLRTHRPDAIFMDHMMSGMDGLQAVQAIKSNPRTATIPIMMYTSQEGELYVGQARALGAIGVLPKQIKPADVTKVLYQLNLAVDRRSSDQSSLRAVVETLAASADAGYTHTGTHPLYAPDPPLPAAALREQLIDLRRTVLAGFDAQGDRLLADVRAVLHEPHPPAEGPPPPAPRTVLPWLLAAAALGAAAILALLAWQQATRASSLESEVAQLRAAALVSPAAAEPPAAPADAPAAASAPAEAAPAARVTFKPIIQSVPYGVEPFSGGRLDAMRQLFDRLITQGFQGNVDIRTYSGRFCLVGNATDGFSLAPDDLPYSKCDLVSGTHDDAAASGMRIPVVMADLMSTVRAGSHDLIHVQVSGGDGSPVAYPVVSDMLTAGDWNRAAGANNRIEIRFR